MTMQKQKNFDGEDADDVVKGIAIGVGIALLTKVAEWAWEKYAKATEARPVSEGEPKP